MKFGATNENNGWFLVFCLIDCSFHRTTRTHAASATSNGLLLSITISSESGSRFTLAERCTWSTAHTEFVRVVSSSLVKDAAQTKGTG